MIRSGHQKQAVGRVKKQRCEKQVGGSGADIALRLTTEACAVCQPPVAHWSGDRGRGLPETTNKGPILKDV